MSRLRSNGNRAHFNVAGRFVTVVVLQDRLYCLDSPCYHSSGPLGEGVVEDIEDIPCIRCPWHNFLVALDTGEEVQREMLAPNFNEDGVYVAPSFPLQPQNVGPASRKGKIVQRVHRCFVDDGTQDVVIELEDEDHIKLRPLASDTSARHEKRGAMSMQIRNIKLMEQGSESAK